jgi:hypothetical protein
MQKYNQQSVLEDNGNDEQYVALIEADAKARNRFTRDRFCPNDESRTKYLWDFHPIKDPF